MTCVTKYYCDLSKLNWLLRTEVYQHEMAKMGQAGIPADIPKRVLRSQLEEAGLGEEPIPFFPVHARCSVLPGLSTDLS